MEIVSVGEDEETVLSIKLHGLIDNGRSDGS